MANIKVLLSLTIVALLYLSIPSDGAKKKEKKEVMTYSSLDLIQSV